MKFVSLCVLAAAFLAAPCTSEMFFMELPGYAKTVVGGYGKTRISWPTICFSMKNVAHIGNLSTSWYEPQRPFYSFRSFHYAAKPTYETRFLVMN